MPGLLQQRRDCVQISGGVGWGGGGATVMDLWLQAVAVGDLFAPGGGALRFHRLGLLFAGRFGAFAFLFLGGERRVGGRARAVFERIWEERFSSLALY